MSGLYCGGGVPVEEVRVERKSDLAASAVAAATNKGALPVDQPSVRGQRSIGTRSNRQIYEMTRKCVIECAPRNLPAMHE